MSKKPYRFNKKDVVVKAENALYTNNGMAGVADVKGALDNINERVEELEENGSGGGGGEIPVDAIMNGLSANAVQNKVIKQYVDGKLTEVTVNSIPAGSVAIADNTTTDSDEVVLSGRQGKKLDENKQPRMEIFVAASNAPDWQKQGADFICDGTNDEVEIQAAINALYNTGGRIRLSSGTFWIDSWQHTRHNYAGAYGKVALMIPHDKYVKFIIEGDAQPLSLTRSQGGTIVRVSNALYESTGANEYCAILAPTWIGLQASACVTLKVSNMRFQIPWNQKPIMCIDTFCCSRADISHIDCYAYISNYDQNWTPVASEPCPIPVEGCVAIRSVGGGNWGTVADYKNIFVFGFHEGFKFAGEHVIGINIAAMYCYYPFTFGNWNYTGISGHPMTFINISEEHCCCGPYFHHADFQQIDFIGYNNEVIPSRTPGGARLKEATIQSGKEGEFFGNITYTSMYGSYVNKANARFWEPGQIHHFNTKNMLTEPQHQEPS